MRLTPNQIQAIKQLAHHHFGPNAKVWVFGSRVDDSRRGGDIDLLIETDIEKAEDVVESDLAFRAQLKAQIGEQRIDVLVDFPARKQRPAIFKVAKETGVRV